MNNIVLSFFLSFSFYVAAQQEVYIAPLRHDAAGAYTLIHDDFGAYYARGIEEYVDTMTYNRGLPICFAAIAGECDATDWTKAKELIAHGHQILNHSMNHKCGIPQDWCTYGDWNEKDFSTEIDKSTELIHKNTKRHPEFFVFPFDLHTDTMVNYLRSLYRYKGSRAGEERKLNPLPVKDFFRLNFTVLRPELPLTDLNQLASEAIASHSWAIRVMHGIEDESWGHRTKEEYASHLHYLKEQVQKNQLWMTTLSEMENFQYNKSDITSIKITKRNKKGGAIELHFERPYTISRAKSTIYDNTLTVVLLHKGAIPKAIVQQEKKLTVELRDNKLLFNADPDLGDVYLTY